MEPLVSVVVPAFDAADTIAETIRSVLAQTMSNVELIVCDDASLDDTVSVVRGFSDERVRLVRNPRNAGPGGARDIAIAQACGQWLAVLDADDVWVPTRLERLLDVREACQDCMVFDDIMICHDGPQGIAPWRRLRGRRAFGASGASAREVAVAQFLRAERLLIKPLIPRSLIERTGVQHSSRAFGEDAEFFIKLVHHGAQLRYLPEPLYLYRATPGSATAKAGSHLMRECIEDCFALGWSDPEIRAAFVYKIEWLRQNELLYEMAGHVRQGRVLAAISLLGRNPGLLRVLPRRAARLLAYRLHRAWHRAEGR